jgi:hypothetical protein
MRNATDVVVQRAIVHRINHLKQTLTNSEVELDLNASPKLRDYFSDQVKNALGDSQTSSARFSPDGNQTAKGEISKILTNGNDFIPSSLELARLLMNSMGTDARIKPEVSNVAICIYIASNYAGSNFLALIKIDPNEALVEKVVTVNGKKLVTFDVLSDVMPTKEVKLRKAALIPPKEKVKDLDLLLLDRQVTGVANFFAVTFLNTLTVLNPTEAAKGFLSVAEKARRSFLEAKEDAPEHIGLKESDLFMRHVETAVRRGSFDRAKFASKAPIPSAAQEVLAERLQKRFPQDIKIEFDKKYAKDLFLTKVRFRGDRGVLLEVDSEHFNRVVTKMTQDPPLPDGTINTRLELLVPNLHRIT